VNGKGGRQRTSILPRSVLEALEAHLQGRTGGYVFEGRDRGHISTRQIQRLLDRAAEEAGLQETRPGRVRQRKRITPHLLRHSFSRWSLDAGIDISYLQHQLGHSSLTTTAIYLQARPNHRRKAYENAGFDGLLNARDSAVQNPRQQVRCGPREVIGSSKVVSKRPMVSYVLGMAGLHTS